MAISALERGSSKPRSLVILTLDSGVHRFLTGTHDTIDDAWPIVSSIGDVGQELNVKTRKVSYGETDIVFMDDGALRGIVSTETVKNRVIQIFQGTESLPEGSFTQTFQGLMTESKPSVGAVVISARDTRGTLLDRKIRAREFVDSSSDIVINRHPLQIILAILEALLPAAQIDIPSFDPDNYDTGSRAISHWTTARAYHGSHDRTIDTPIPALQMIDELAMLMEGAVIAGIDGKIRFQAFDPSGTPVVTFQQEDIGKVEQTGTYTEQANDVELEFSWRGEKADDNGVLVRVPSGSAKSYKKGDYGFAWNSRDATSIAKHQIPGGPALSGRYAETFETPWVGVDTVLEFPHSDTALTLTCVGGWASSFCGIDRILNGVSDGSVNGGVNTTNRKGYLLAQFPEVNVLNDGSLQTVFPYEVIQYSDITIDFLSSGHPAVNGNDDLVGIPIRVTFTIPAGGRGQFFTNALDLPKNALISDLTIPIQFTQRRILRLTNGLPIYELEVGLEHIDLEVADLVSIAGDDIFLAEGQDGLSGSETLEILKKTTRADDSVVLEVTLTEDPVVAGDDVLHKPAEGSDDWKKWPRQNDDASSEDGWVVGGTEILPGTGLEVEWRRGRIQSRSGSVEVGTPSGSNPPLAMEATRDNYILYDTHSRMFHVRAVTIGDPAPEFATGQICLGKAETDGAGVVGEVEDLRQTTRLIASPLSSGGANIGILGGALTNRFRDISRYPPDGLEVFPMSTVWGASGATGNDAELDFTAGTFRAGDASVKLFTPLKGVRTPLYAVDGSFGWTASWVWTGTLLGDAIGEVEFLAADKRTIVGTTIVFTKLPTTVTVLQDDGEVIQPPATARWARLTFRKGLSTGPGVFVNLDSMTLERARDSFHVVLTNNQSITRVTWTVLLFNVIDTAGPFPHNIGLRYTPFDMITPGAPFFTCRTTGVYEFEGSFRHGGQNPHYNSFLGLWVTPVATGVPVLRKFAGPGKHGDASLSNQALLSTRITCGAGDLVVLRGWQDANGGAKTIQGDPFITWFTGKQVS